MFKILDTFDIAGRGVVIMLDGVTNLPIGKELVATVYLTDGSTASFPAYKEFLLKRQPVKLENECFLLSNAKKSEVPIGCNADFEAKEH